MSGIFVLAEHRKGVIQDVTWEMLNKGKELASRLGAELVAVVLGYRVRDFSEKLSQRAEQVLVVEDERLENFNGEIYQRVLAHIISEQKPVLTLIGHTAFGMDLAPSLAAQLRIPISTDCLDLYVEDGNLTTIRQMYGGKVSAEISFSRANEYMVTVRPGSFVGEGEVLIGGKIKTLSPPLEEVKYKRFIEYIEAVVGKVDITQADILVSVGNGIGDSKDVPLIAGLAEALGGQLSCSRPVVDKKWLPKERQVGISGKTVKPKVYIAIGISGAFQHIAGIKGALLLL